MKKFSQYINEEPVNENYGDELKKVIAEIEKAARAMRGMSVGNRALEVWLDAAHYGDIITDEQYGLIADIVKI